MRLVLRLRSRYSRKHHTVRRALTIRAVHFVYIVRCRDGTLYTGYARDPLQRTKTHNSGRGARYTSGRLPVTLAYSESFESKTEALRREYELKRWSRARKEALIRSS
jgi:putative endonuclease